MFRNLQTARHSRAVQPFAAEFFDEVKRHEQVGRELVRLRLLLFTLTLVCGVCVHDMTLGTTLANLGFSDVRFPKPVFFGDTIYTETEVISKRESKSRSNTGIVEFQIRGRHQREELVVSLRRTGMMLKRNPPKEVAAA